MTPTSEHHFEIDNLPNRLTIFRVLLIPVIIGCLWFSHPELELAESTVSLLGHIAGWVFAVAAITDFLDGHIARRRKLETLFGSFLDPIADKFLVVSSLILLGHVGRIPILLVIVLVLRELYMTSLRLLALNEGIDVPVNRWGKWKTATQMVGIPFLMANAHVGPLSLWLVGSALIYVAGFLSLFSAGLYSLGLLRKLQQRRKRKKEQKKATLND